MNGMRPKKNHPGKKFVSDVEKKLLEIVEHPELYSLVMGRIRRAFCKKFPYSIYFLNNGADIVVIGVLHQRRNPELWQNRR